MLTKFCITDIATAPIDGCAEWLEEPSAPSNWKDPAKIAAYVAEKKADQTERAGLDPDLGRITGLGLWMGGHADPVIMLCKTEDEERGVLQEFAGYHDGYGYPLIGYNALKFDWPFLMRRAAYLGVPLGINTDRYRSPHVDLCDVLSHRGVLTARSLGFYVRRLGMGLVKPLSGSDESLVPVTGRWDELAASLVHDVTATRKLAEWLAVIAPVRAEEPEPVVG